ncbi:hypothetical protein [Henriciella sp.]|uniref:hypothetical protein n=1 Tax=Henriciella sp. TaxID=1968823 RepID=UPI002629BDC8|nr:hypothetical protein [Henriciella sp.]
MQANTVLAVLGLAIASSACAMAETENLADPATASLTGEACPDVGERAYFFWMQPRSAEPGDEISLSPYWTDMPGSYNDLPPGCVGDLEAFPEDAVTFDRQDDGLAIASISADAEPGTRVRLEATYRGAYALSGIVDIYREEENPLVGLWRQAGDSCPPESAVRELVFTGGNEMSVTWTPFEVYKDYWADYQYDPQTGAFSFEVEGGNQIPEDIVAAGTAQVDGDRLVFKDVFFGTPRQAEGGCRATFVR